MTASNLAERLTSSASHLSQDAFLSSHRANAACRRELDRLHAEVGRQLEELTAAGNAERVEVRASPDRWIVQLGPVALTIAWLLGARDAIAEGELLAIVWRGIPGQKRSQLPERLGVTPPPSASALWEQVLVPVAPDEATWGWLERGAGTDVRSSADIAAQCVARLQTAYESVESEQTAAPEIPAQPGR